MLRTLKHSLLRKLSLYILWVIDIQQEAFNEQYNLEAQKMRNYPIFKEKCKVKKIKLDEMYLQIP